MNRLRKFFRFILILCGWYLLTGGGQTIFSQAVTIRSYRLAADFDEGTPMTYCSATTKDTLWGVNPTSKSFGINGPPPSFAGADPVGIVNERVGGSFTGKAFVDLALCLATYGPSFEFSYHQNSRRWPVTITSPLLLHFQHFRHIVLIIPAISL